MASDNYPPLRPLRLRIAEAARIARKPQYVLEKDYSLSYLLAGIAAVPSLAESLVFKGGTCLRKAYFPGYRFSEDLDFTSLKPWADDTLLRALESAGEQMKAGLLAFGPFEVIVAEEHQRELHPRGQCMFRVRVQFPWMRSPDCALKVEVSTQEPVLAGTVERRLLHDFEGESLDVTIAAYRLEEIAAEKLRAFSQSRQHLRDRGWLRNRPRDLYDLCYLKSQRDSPVDWKSVGRILPGKAESCGITYAGPEDFLDEQVLAGIKRDWKSQLANFVTDLPSFEGCLAGLKAIVGDVPARQE